MILLFIPGMVIWIRYSLYAPVVLIEGLQGKAAMRRARELASRSWRTVYYCFAASVGHPDDGQLFSEADGRTG